MAKKEATKKKMAQEMTIFLNQEAHVAKVEKGNLEVLGDFKYTIVVVVKEGIVDALKLYRGETHVLNVYGALLDAFFYDCKCSRSCFLGDENELRTLFLEKVGNPCLKKAEKTEIRKFVYLMYVQAKEILEEE